MMRPSQQASEAGVSTETEQVGQAAVAARDRLGPDSARVRTRLGSLGREDQTEIRHASGINAGELWG
jgi:hypothetical protein